MVDCSGYNCSGGWMSAALNYVRRRRIHHEFYYRYTARNGRCRSISRPKIHIRGYGTVRSRNMLDFLVKLSRKPLTVALFVNGNFFRYRGGILPTTTCRNIGRRLNHGVTAVGYYINLRDWRRSYIIVKNSWGRGWGENGFFRIALPNILYTNGVCNMIMLGRETLYPF